MKTVFFSAAIALLSLSIPVSAQAQSCQCISHGETLWKAVVNFRMECSNFQRNDCDPIQGRWYCSNQRITGQQIPTNSCRESITSIEDSSSIQTTEPVSQPAIPGQIINLSELRQESGHAFILTINAGVPGDSLGNGRTSTLQLFENGQALGPAHSLHRDIRNIGQGRFSHWGNQLYFSSSDNSNPANNRRVYSYTLGGQVQPSTPPIPQPRGSSSNNNTSQPTVTNVTPDPSPINNNQGSVDGVAYSGLTPGMWAEIREQANRFGDNNRCQQRVNAIPSTGHTIGPCTGNCINQALANHDLVFLRPGRYRISEQIRFNGKTLVGLDPTQVIIDASQVDRAMSIGSNSTVSNLTVVDARNSGIFATNNNTLYRVSVYRTGFSNHSNSTGSGIQIYRGSGNCVVSVESSDGYNEDGNGCAPCENGGNADGIYSKFQSSRNSFIDAHAYRNSDDGFDFWESTGPMFIYFSSAYRNGTNLAGNITGDGNGFKLGRGSFPVYIYKSRAYNNPSRGFDVNGNTVEPIAIGSESTGNGRDWVGISIR